jgi:hypothetical protein
MTFGTDRSNDYLQGIQRAERDGLIIYARTDAATELISDDYSHIGSGGGAPVSLKYTNTRPLSFLARQILNLYESSAKFRFLELGPGAGVACASVNRFLPQAEIDTVSLTPLNPYLRFSCHDLYAHIAEPPLHVTSSSCLFEPCALPFVRHQYIGRFPNEIIPPNNDYHFIYENHGAILYNFDPHRRDGSTELGHASIVSALSLLRPDGTMLITASDGSCRMEELLESIMVETDVVVTCKRTTAYHSLPCIVAKGESPLSARLRRSGLLPEPERILRLESNALDDVMLKVCAF